MLFSALKKNHLWNEWCVLFSNILPAADVVDHIFLFFGFISNNQVKKYAGYF